MKKSVVAVLVGLLAVVLFMQYMQKRNAVPATRPVIPQTEVMGGGDGVPLPAASTSYTASTATGETFVQRAVAPFRAPASSAEVKKPMKTLPVEEASLPICAAGKTLNDVLSSHGKEWGYGARSSSGTFSDQDTGSIYTILAKYFSCQAVVYNDPAMCNFLPRSKEFGTPYHTCSEGYNLVTFFAYASGKDRQEQPCRRFYAAGRYDVDEKTFCAAAAQGIENLCDTALSYAKEKCQKVYPKHISGCADPECRNNYMLYYAIKNDNIAGCSEDHEVGCKAYFTGSPKTCASLLKPLGDVYCRAFMDPKRAANVEAERKLEGEMNNERQRQIKLMNENIRKQIGKQ